MEEKLKKVPKLRFKDDDGSEFPEWEEKKLGEVCEIIGGGTPDTKTDSYWNGSIPWFTPSEIGLKKYVHTSQRTISEEGLKHSSAKLLPIGAILLTTRATLGEMSITTVPCCTNQGFQSLVAKIANNEFVYYLKGNFISIFRLST